MTTALALGHFVMGLVFFVYADQPTTATAFLVSHALACLLLGHRRPSPTPLIASGALVAAIGTQPLLPLMGVGLVIAAGGCAAMNIGLADLLSATNAPSTTTLQAQAFVAAGNGTAPVLWGTVGTDTAVAISSVAALGLAVAVGSGVFHPSRPPRGQPETVGIAAIMSGVAVGAQIVMIAAVPALLDPTLRSAVTVGGGLGIVIGRSVAATWPALVRPRGLRAALIAGGLASVAIPTVTDPLVVGMLVLVATASIGPIFPMAMVASYGRPVATTTITLSRGPSLVIGTASLMAALAPAATAALTRLGASATLAAVAALLATLGLIAPRHYRQTQQSESP